jgi:hypothetical protein
MHLGEINSLCNLASENRTGRALNNQNILSFALIATTTHVDATAHQAAGGPSLRFTHNFLASLVLVLNEMVLVLVLEKAGTRRVQVRVRNSGIPVIMIGNVGRPKVQAGACGWAVNNCG